MKSRRESPRERLCSERRIDRCSIANYIWFHYTEASPRLGLHLGAEVRLAGSETLDPWSVVPDLQMDRHEHVTPAT